MNEIRQNFIASTMDIRTKNKSSPGRKATRGFTMIEMLATVTIAVILFGISAPNMMSFIKNSEITAISNQFTGAVNLARSSAITEQKPVVICSSTTGTLCTGSAWEAGWMMYIVENNGDRRTLAIGDPLNEEISVSFNGFDVSTQISFNTAGTINGTNTTGDIVICDQRGNQYANAILINSIGRPVLATDSNDDQIVEGINRTNVSCT